MKARTIRFPRIVGMLLIIPVIPIALWFAGSAGSDQGSARLASEWRALLSQFNDPDTAVTENERIWVIRCKNDEWIFGLAQGSHGIWRRCGGTVVTKDSNGVTRSFRGHVCWPTGSPFRGCSTESLAAVCGEIGEMGFHPLTLGEQHENIGLQEAADGRTPEVP